VNSLIYLTNEISIDFIHGTGIFFSSHRSLSRFRIYQQIWKQTYCYRVYRSILWSLQIVRWTQSTTLHSTSLRLILISLSQLYLGLPGSSFLSCTPESYTYSSQVRTWYAPCPIILLYLIILIMKNSTFWDVTPCYACKNWSSVGTYRLQQQGDKNRWARNNVSSN
jgi:hypothetical protein